MFIFNELVFDYQNDCLCYDDSSKKQQSDRVKASLFFKFIFLYFLQVLNYFHCHNDHLCYVCSGKKQRSDRAEADNIINAVEGAQSDPKLMSTQRPVSAK